MLPDPSIYSEKNNVAAGGASSGTTTSYVTSTGVSVPIENVAVNVTVASPLPFAGLVTVPSNAITASLLDAQEIATPYNSQSLIPKGYHSCF